MRVHVVTFVGELVAYVSVKRFSIYAQVDIHKGWALRKVSLYSVLLFIGKSVFIYLVTEAVTETYTQTQTHTPT